MKPFPNIIFGFTLDWNYDKGFVDISMPNYVKDALVKLQYKTRKHPQYSPHDFHAINWTRKGNQQYSTKEDTSPFLDKKRNYICAVCDRHFSLLCKSP